MSKMSDSTQCKIFAPQTLPSSVATWLPWPPLFSYTCEGTFRFPLVFRQGLYCIFAATVTTRMSIASFTIVVWSCRLCVFLSAFGDSRGALLNQ
jgi:hypothetical protein